MAAVKVSVKNILRKVLPGHAPDFIIVGAQKAGTTSLHFYLRQHPKIVGSRPKEVHFFDRDDRYSLGEKWYRKAFLDLKRPFANLTYFEATPEYLYREKSAERIQKFDPEMKIIILLRDPVKRAYSSWNMYRDFLESGNKLPDLFEKGYVDGLDNNIRKELYGDKAFPTFKEAVEIDIARYASQSPLQEPSFVRRGIYYPQVKKYIDLFGQSNVKVIGFNDLVHEKISTLNQILTFVGLESSDWSFLVDEKRNVRSYPRPIDQDVADELKEFYRPHNDKLFSLLGTKINW